MSKTAKERAFEIYHQHIALASTDGRLFRKTVMVQLMDELECSLSAAATHYNTAKKASPPIEGLGRAAQAAGVKKPGSTKAKSTGPVMQDDNECFSVLELVQSGNDYEIGRCQSFLQQGDASETFDRKVQVWPGKTWVLIQGLGPNSGETYRLDSGEKEIKRYPLPKKVAA